MTLRKRWTAVCDEPGCGTAWVAPDDLRGLYDGEVTAWDAGVAINDADWVAGPTRGREAFCPEHHPTEPSKS